MLPIDLQHLPSTDELPCSDDTPVDNEDQNLLPNILLFLLRTIWAERMDWYFGVDMAVYHTTGEDPTIPVVSDAFLSIGVERKKGGKSRKSYAVWEEAGVVPILVLEMVSQTRRGEYDEKMGIYARLGVLYYVVYNPENWGQKRQQKHQSFEVYNAHLSLRARNTRMEETNARCSIGLNLDLLKRSSNSWTSIVSGINRCLQKLEALRHLSSCI
jgi:Uma2 family endonuclease